MEAPRGNNDGELLPFSLRAEREGRGELLVEPSLGLISAKESWSGKPVVLIPLNCEPNSRRSGFLWRRVWLGYW